MFGSHKFTANVSILLILLSQIINVILPPRNSISPVIWYLWILICVIYVLHCFLSTREGSSNRFLILLFLFWGVNAISFFISPKVLYCSLGVINTIEIFKSITIALLSYYPFYYFSSNGYLSRKQLLVFLIVLYVFYGFDFFTSRASILEDSIQEEGTFNAAYNFALILPLVFMINKKNLNFFLILVSLVLLLLGAKRGALLCFAAEILVFLVYLLKKDSFGREHRVQIIFLLIVAAIFIFLYLGNHDYLSQRIMQTSSEDDLSGQIRIRRYGVLWNQFFHSDLKDILFGYGFAQTAIVGDGLAHQDWIEILIDGGVLSGMIYFFMLFTCYKDIRRRNYTTPIVKYAYICCMMVWIIKGSLSMVYTSRRCFILFVILGIIHGMLEGQTEDRITQ